jgi:hypothetical protein
MAPLPQFFFATMAVEEAEGGAGIYFESRAATPSPMLRE